MGPLRFFLLAVIALLGFCLPGSDALRIRYCSSLNTGKLEGFEAVYDTFQSHGECQKTCSKDYVFAILQENECWCSDAAPGDTTDVDDCDNDCPGYPFETCGNIDEGLFAYIQLNGRPSTTIGSPTTTTSSTTDTSTSATPTDDDGSATTTATDGPTSTSGSGSDGETETGKGDSISGGAIAGIVIGSIAAVAIIAALLWFFCIYRRRNQPKDDNLSTSFFERPVPRPLFQGTLGPRDAALGNHNAHKSNASFHPPGPTQRLSVPAFTDSRLNSNLYPNGSRLSNVSLHDHQDYSRPVLRLTNPDPEP